MKLSDPQSAFVERVGRFWESVSLGRSAGRILGWLMICEPEYQSAAELVDRLGMSTGSVSTQVRLLERIGLLERITFPGDRASYYHLPDGAWPKLMEAELDRITQMRTLARSAAGVIPTHRPERVTDLGEITDFFAEEWPPLLERLAQRLASGKVR